MYWQQQKLKVDPPESAYCTQPLQFIKYKRVKMTTKLTPARNWSTRILQNKSTNNNTFMNQETSNSRVSLPNLPVNLIHPRTLLIYSLHLLWFCADRLGTAVHFSEFHDKTYFSDSKAPHLARQWTMGIWATNAHYTLALSYDGFVNCHNDPLVL